MAKDIFTIPVTSVASESAFSAGGRVLGDYRSALSPKTLNSLVCADSWIRAVHTSSMDPSVRTISLCLFVIIFSLILFFYLFN
ncbi:Putative AC transposase [Apostasia shenzhenica]|uniref:AC transposase n=1 Tax=Apostasia shenzhenica TaxID=1088818 RepID=A0A2I0AFT6_9ASPA|nr:Putative AC transposase [Apostasia shenzhenica]